MIPLPARQIHLDFHTSEHIPGVGSCFDKRQFQEALQAGKAPKVVLQATHAAALKIVKLADLKKHALDLV